MKNDWYITYTLAHHWTKEEEMEHVFSANDALILKSDIPAYVSSEIAELDEVDKARAITAIKGDVKVKAGIITDIKAQLREVNQLKMMYYYQ